MKAGISTALTLALAVAALVGASGQAGASVAAGKVAGKGKCPLSFSEQRSLGASYVYPFKTKGVGCEKAKKVIKAYHECRKAHGGADGHCKSKVKGYKCNEGKREGVPGVQYEAKVTCKNGGKKIVHQYTMNL